MASSVIVSSQLTQSAGGAAWPAVTLGPDSGVYLGTPRNAGQPYIAAIVATPALLRQYGIRPSLIGSGTDILTMRPGLTAAPRMQLLLAPDGPPGPGQPADPCPVSSCQASPKMQAEASLPAGTSAPNTAITMHAVRALGLRPVLDGWLIQTPRPLTAAQISTARQLAAAVGATIETKSGEVSLSEILTGATAVGILIALGVLAMTVGLIRSETGDFRRRAGGRR